MKKIIKSLRDVPNADALLKKHLEKLNKNAITPKEFVSELRSAFGDELLDSTYTSWRGVKQRAKALHSLDGKSLSPQFQEFHSFIACIGIRPCRAYTLDRVNGELGYTETNCRWVDKKAQTRNRANTVYATDKNGQCETLARWAEITGTPLKTLSKRRSAGWSDPDIIHGRSPIGANPIIRKRFVPYGSSGRIDYSPSGDHWPPKTQQAWELARGACHGWSHEDKVEALNFVDAHRISYIKQEAEYIEDIFVPDREGCDPWQPSDVQRSQLKKYSQRIRYFSDWLYLAHRAMFPDRFIPPGEVW